MAAKNKALIRGKACSYPKAAACPMCGSKVFEPHQFVVLSGGGIKMDRRKRSGGPSDDIDGFLDLTFHGAHDGGQAHDPVLADADAHVRLADEVRGGQFEFYFCSTKCLRAFLNKQVDDLEAGLERWVAKHGKVKRYHGPGPRDEIS
jgi:hypothetical protein